MAHQEILEAGVYIPKDAVSATIHATMVTTGAGAFVSTIQNTLTRQNVGAMGMFTKTGGTIAVFGGLHDACTSGDQMEWLTFVKVQWEEHMSLPI